MSASRPVTPADRTLALTLNGQAYEWQADTSAEFDDWWQGTAWAKALQAQTPGYFNPSWGSKTRSSKAWKSFGEAAMRRDGQPKIFCLTCKSTLKHPSAYGIGTTHMRSHLTSRACTRISGIQPESIHTMLQKVSCILICHARSVTPKANLHCEKSSNQIPQYSVASWQKEFTKAIIDSNTPFRAVENQQFRKMLLMLKPSLVIPSATTVRKNIHEYLVEVMASIKRTIPARTRHHICLDNWTSTNHIAFMGITIHYIDHKWRLRELLIGFEPLFEAHTGKHMAKVLAVVLVALALQDRTMCITTDNASNNTTMAEAVEQDHLRNWNCAQYHLPCFAHVINLVTQAFINALRANASNERLDTNFNETTAFTSLRKCTPGSFQMTLEKVYLTFLFFDMPLL